MGPMAPGSMPGPPGTTMAPGMGDMPGQMGGGMGGMPGGMGGGMPGQMGGGMGGEVDPKADRAQFVVDYVRVFGRR